MNATNRDRNQIPALLTLVAGLWAAASPAFAQVQATVGDVTSLKGQGTNVLIGTGLVTGLAGTGDGEQSAAAMRALAEVMRKLGAPVANMEELKDSKNVAIVSLEVVLPDQGAREGDLLDVQVTSIGAAKSLEGGRLLVTPLIYHDLNVPGVFATCRGPLQLPNPAIKTTAVVRKGASIEQDVLLSFMASGRDIQALFPSPWIQPDNHYVTLVIEESHAGWGLATEIASVIDTELSLVADVEHVAMAVDPRNVVVLLPAKQNPAQWISDIQGLSLLVPEGQAKVTINRASGTIIVSGNATISPVVVSQKGLTVKVAGSDSARAGSSGTEEQRFIPIDPGPERRANVSDLLVALNRLQVPIEDRIAILSEINRMGRLHAQLMLDE